MSSQIRFILILSAAALAVGAAACPAQKAPYGPWLEDVLLDKSESIVVASWERTTTLPSREVLYRFQVKRSLKGGREKQVLVIGADRSILSDTKVDKLLFLKRSRRGSFRILMDFVDLPRRDAANRVDFLHGYIKALADTKLSRPLAVKKLCFEHVATRSQWVKRILVREIHRLATWDESLFTSADLVSLDKLDVSKMEKGERKLLSHARMAVEEGKALRWTRSRLVFPDPAVRKAYLADMALFEQSDDSEKRLQFMKDTLETFGRRSAPFFASILRDRMPEIASRAAFYLGEMESAAGLSRLIELARAGENTALREASVVALGKIASPRAVDTLVGLISKKGLEKAVLKALVAIDTPASLQAVRAHDEALRRDPESLPELRLYTARVLSPDFARELEQEHRARKARFSK